MPKTNLTIGSWHSEHVTLATVSPPRSEVDGQQQRHLFLSAGWFFVVVTLILAASIIHPAWRQHWRWGTKKSGAPMTGVGRIAWLFAFGACSVACFARGLGTDTGILTLSMMFVAFAFLLGAAWFDSSKFRQQKK